MPVTDSKTIATTAGGAAGNSAAVDGPASSEANAGGADAGTVQRRRMLDLSRLHPGDVILCSFNERASEFLVNASRAGKPERKYSHAAVVAHSYEWFESAKPEGIGYTRHKPDKIELCGGVSTRLHDLSVYGEFAVFRHPAVSVSTSADYKEWASLIINLSTEFLGFQYPDIRKLANELPWIKSQTRIQQILKRIAEADEIERPINPGLFCSQLVVYVYERLSARCGERLSIFRDPAFDPSSCSPNDLADGDLSELRLIDGAVVSERPDLPDFDHLPSRKFRDEAWVQEGRENHSRLMEAKIAAIRKSRGEEPDIEVPQPSEGG
jgi:hypothetical protein